jgi:hypothetical protein
MVVRDLFADATADPKLWRFMSTSVWTPGTAPVEISHCTYAEYGTLIADALESAVRRGELTPGPTLVRVLVAKGAVGEALDSFVLFNEPALTPELADQLVDAVFGSWLAAPGVTNGQAAPSSPSELSSSQSPPSQLSRSQSSPSSSQS